MPVTGWYLEILAGNSPLLCHFEDHCTYVYIYTNASRNLMTFWVRLQDFALTVQSLIYKRDSNLISISQMPDLNFNVIKNHAMNLVFHPPLYGM